MPVYIKAAFSRFVCVIQKILSNIMFKKTFFLAFWINFVLIWPAPPFPLFSFRHLSKSRRVYFPAATGRSFLPCYGSLIELRNLELDSCDNSFGHAAFFQKTITKTIKASINPLCYIYHYQRNYDLSLSFHLYTPHQSLFISLLPCSVVNQCNELKIILTRILSDVEAARQRMNRGISPRDKYMKTSNAIVVYSYKIYLSGCF